MSRGPRDSQAGMQRGRAPGEELPPFPARQLFILALCRISEPIAFMSIFPYIYYMVRDFGITEDESKISFYAGMVTSAFTLAEFSTSVLWGRLSDKIGRKPVLLMGLAGTGLSVLTFGFAQSLPVALFARALGGFLNGNIGVLQTTVAELVTHKEHQPSAYAVMPVVWCIGSIVGPMIGGAFARPVETMPGWFSKDGLFGQRPYLLPNLVSASCVFVGVIIGILFLNETHAERKLRRDPGIELGNYLMSRASQISQSFTRKPRGKSLEELALLGETDELLPGYCTEGHLEPPATSPAKVSQDDLDREETGLPQQPKEKPAAGRTFSFMTIRIIVTFGILAFHTMVFDSLLPIFLSSKMPKSHQPTSLPFKFVGGFGFDTKTIGAILSMQGLYAMAATVFVFPRIVRLVGPRRLFKTISISYPLLYIATPYLVLLPESWRMVGIYGIVVWKCTLSTLAYPSNTILLTNSAPSTLSLGMINGVSGSVASLSRAAGPAISGWLYSMGLESGYSGLVWWFTAVVTVLGAWISIAITESHEDLDEKDDDETTTTTTTMTTTTTAPTGPRNSVDLM